MNYIKLLKESIEFPNLFSGEIEIKNVSKIMLSLVLLIDKLYSNFIIIISLKMLLFMLKLEWRLKCRINCLI